MQLSYIMAGTCDNEQLIINDRISAQLFSRLVMPLQHLLIDNRVEKSSLRHTKYLEELKYGIGHLST
jgi:hypothetical protein